MEREKEKDSDGDTVNQPSLALIYSDRASKKAMAAREQSVIYTSFVAIISSSF